MPPDTTRLAQLLRLNRDSWSSRWRLRLFEAPSDRACSVTLSFAHDRS